MTTQMKLQNGRWLLNNKTFEKCSHKEKKLFNLFFKQVKKEKGGLPLIIKKFKKNLTNETFFF